MDPRELREATRAEHEATEALMPSMGPGLTKQAYVAILRTLLPIVESWEGWASARAPEGLQELLPPRRRARLLVEDLRLLGGGTDNAARPGVDWEGVIPGGAGGSEEEFSESEFEARFLGMMYVMEGSTLGGRFLARQVEAALHLEPGRGNAYFQGFGDATGPMWREVTQKLAGVPEEFSPVVIAAARRAFRAFGDALRPGSLREDLYELDGDTPGRIERAR